MLCESSIRWGVFGDNGDKFVCERLDGSYEGAESRRSQGVGTSGDVGYESREERLRDRGNFNRSLFTPYNQRIVQLLGNREGSKVPWLNARINTASYDNRQAYVATEVNIFRIPANSYALVGRDARVDAIDAPERVNVDFEVGKRLVRARLECRRITTNRSIKCVDACEDCVGVLSGSATTSIGNDVSSISIPVAL